MKIILRASNLLLFFMQRPCTFDVNYLFLEMRLNFFLFCHSDQRILTRLHWRTAELDARVARIPDVILSPHLEMREIPHEKSRDCTHGRCGRRSVTTIDEVEPDTHSQHQCEQLEKDLMAKYKDKCVCQFRNAPHLPLHLLPFALARVEGHRIRTASGLAKIAHSFRLDLRHHPITSSRRADL